ncbi:hypothetical protein ACFXHA_45080 [Nocardia sp. NPDC059240]|uniref:hypothetical protein n=1 Tax=Nocardia sp. NPDC059240 TaxID=3346786 RepID=UPI0036C6E605
MSKHRAGLLHRFTRRHQTAPAIAAREGLDARRALADAPTVVLPVYVDPQADAITEELPVVTAGVLGWAAPWPVAEQTAATIREHVLDGVAGRRSLAVQGRR